MKHILKSFYRYHIRGRYNYLQAAHAIRKNNSPVLVYTMAKVGSLSVANSLQKAKLHRPVYHIHTLQQEKIKVAYDSCREKGWWPDSMNPGALIKENIIDQGKSIQIITAVRDPIERNVSAFFEVFRYYIGQSANEFEGHHKVLQSTFMEALPHDFPLNWFDQELYPCTSIDVYEQEFDTELKIAKHEKGNTKLLLFRSDLDDRLKEAAIESFLNLADFKLINQNVGAKKAYASKYAEFKERLILPESYLDRMLQSKYTKYFYSESEINQMYRKWTKG